MVVKCSSPGLFDFKTSVSTWTAISIQGDARIEHLAGTALGLACVTDGAVITVGALLSQLGSSARDVAQQCLYSGSAGKARQTVCLAHAVLILLDNGQVTAVSYERKSAKPEVQKQASVKASARKKGNVELLGGVTVVDSAKGACSNLVFYFDLRCRDRRCDSSAPAQVCRRTGHDATQELGVQPMPDHVST